MRICLLLLLVACAALAQLPGWETQLPPYEQANLALNRQWVAQRRARGEPPARVGVYADAGVWHLGLVNVVACLEQAQLPCRALLHEDLGHLEGVQGVVLPGGYAPYQYAAMGPEGLGRIRGFVTQGGRCLGVCAGAYLLSQTVRYLGLSFPYPLGLFDGVAEGPVAGLAAYPASGPVTVKVTPAGEQRGLAVADGRTYLYGGGPRFLGGTGVSVLLLYPDGTPAAIQRSVGQGEIVATGVHMERPGPAEGGDEAPPPPGSASIYKALLGL